MDPTALKIAIAMALYRQKNPLQQSSSSESDAQRWMKKAKDRKLEILRLREELKLLEDGRGSEVVPEISSCRCHFFDGCGDLKNIYGDDRDRHWINDVLRRRFFRLVRWKGRRGNLDYGSVRRKIFAEFDEENEIERLSTSIDFLVELADGISLKGRSESSFSGIFHQAVDFILASLKNLLSSQKELGLIEDIVHGLIMRLAGRMCTTAECDETSIGSLDVQVLVQQLLRKLGTIAFVGQNTMLLISRKISATAEGMLFMNPFDDAFPSTHCNIFLMIQLLEFLISDNIQSWISDEDFDCNLFEEWVRYIVQARKGLELLECRNVLYALYMDRVTGQLFKMVGPLFSAGKLDPELLPSLLHR